MTVTASSNFDNDIADALSAISLLHGLTMQNALVAPLYSPMRPTRAELNELIEKSAAVNRAVALMIEQLNSIKVSYKV